jgi:hypothetical protein
MNGEHEEIFCNHGYWIPYLAMDRSLCLKIQKDDMSSEANHDCSNRDIHKGRKCVERTFTTGCLIMAQTMPFWGGLSGDVWTFIYPDLNCVVGLAIMKTGGNEVD